MKLLVFSPYYPPHTGGLESHSDEFNKYLSQEGGSITVFTPRLPEDALEKEIRHNGVEIVRFPAVELFHNYPVPKFWERKFWQLWKSLPTTKPDLVLSRTRFFFPSLMAWRFARKHDRPLVHIEHGSDFAQFNSPLKTGLGKMYDYTLGAFVLRHSDQNIANSEASARFVKLLSGRVDCQVIYRGIERDLLTSIPPSDDVRKKYGEAIIIGYIGRLIDGKGIADLISALAPLRERNFICLIVGSGPEQKRLEEMILTHGLTEKIFLLGQKDFAGAMGILKIFDIFVNPSYTEGIPTAVIEAALCHKAIIATNVGGTKEIISGTGDGFLIPAKNVSALTEKLTLLIENPELRATFSKNAFDGVKNKFDWNRSADQYLALFDKILKEKMK